MLANLESVHWIAKEGTTFTAAGHFTVQFRRGPNSIKVSDNLNITLTSILPYIDSSDPSLSRSSLIVYSKKTEGEIKYIHAHVRTL